VRRELEQSQGEDGQARGETVGISHGSDQDEQAEQRDHAAGSLLSPGSVG
jgi:hypothetical protein